MAATLFQNRKEWQQHYFNIASNGNNTFSKSQGMATTLFQYRK